MNGPQQEENIVSGIYDGYSDTQKEIMELEKKKTRNKLFTLAVLIFASDFLALLVLDAVNTQTLLIIAVIPLVFVGLAFLALKEPMLAMIIGALILVGAWTYTIIATGGQAAISGWLIKAIAVYLLFAGFQNAREAQRIKKELNL
ncbi:MAG: hypothetical protein JNJ86_05680 [Chitinophagaceae bacterium]|jgi:hypothetical protein|nr:hypothetical protein [Chitinophagaceae bacterium]